jgi:hypothetical protein
MSERIAWVIEDLIIGHYLELGVWSLDFDGRGCYGWS